MSDIVERLAAEYHVIAAFYGDRTAKRSGVRLMAHIDEGLALLTKWGASDLAHRAFCLHPIVQNGEDFEQYHGESHPRRHELRRYFHLWKVYLRQPWVAAGYCDGDFESGSTLVWRDAIDMEDVKEIYAG